eukprot:TRINITY_DN22990_c1_g1_i1.p2 TRINITY_DN22990_c1_g1~~TRINITY_DN22990_c1_g1_i1.p2  ORF type:complete len:157 (-),score=58.67 TRINITY_DN22990_c1_g1_i1:90-524(-)
MSEEGDVVAVPEVAAEETPLKPALDPLTAVQEVLKKALVYDGLARGLKECAKALDSRRAHLCLLASDCDEPNYVKLVEALCAEHNISLMHVPEAKKLGEWAGLRKLDQAGEARKVVGCSCVVIKNYGEETDALQYLLEHLKNSS